MIERALPSARGFTSPVDPAALARHLASIAKALDAGALTRAQLLGLYLPFNELTQRQLERLRKGARLDKRSFNPVEPRDERGRWTAGVPFAATSAGSSPRSGRRDRANSRGDAARQSPSEREHLAIYPSLDEAAKGAIPGAIAAAQKDRDEHDEYAVSIFPVKGGFSFDGPHLVLLDENNKGNFTARPDAVSWYYTHREWGDPSEWDNRFQADFEARGGKPAYIFIVPVEPDGEVALPGSARIYPVVGRSFDDPIDCESHHCTFKGRTLAVGDENTRPRFVGSRIAVRSSGGMLGAA